MPFVIVRMLTGRTDDQKRRLVKAITDAVVETTGAKAEGTTVVIEEIPRNHWAKAGVLLSDQE